MGELGQLLRQTREEKGIALDQVAHETRIRVRFLEALEQEEYETLPTPGHVHGFLRNYALYLGLDLNEVQALYDSENQGSRSIPGIFRPKDIDLMPPRRPLVRASVVLGIVLTLVALVVSGWAFWYYGLPSLQPLMRLLTPAAVRTAEAEQTAAVQDADAATATQAAVLAAATETPTVTATPTVAEAEPAPAATATEAPCGATATSEATATPTVDRPTATPTPRPTRTPTRIAARTPTPVQGVTLSIRVIERAWMQVTIDGQEQPGELLEVDAERTWEGEQTIHFVCGNAGGIEVTVNGEDLGVLGRRAEVVHRTWTPLGEATPTPSPS